MSDPVEILPGNFEPDAEADQPNTAQGDTAAGQPAQTQTQASNSGTSGDRHEDNDNMATLSQATTASAVNPARPVEQVSTSAAAAVTPNPAVPVAASSSTVRAQNPATPQSSSAASTASSAVPVVQSTAARVVSTAPSTTIVRTTAAASSSSTSVRPTVTSTSTNVRSSSSASSASSSGKASLSSTASGTSSASSTATKLPSDGKSGIGGSGLSLGALIGIIIGGIVGLVLIGMVITRTVRKKQRRDRAKRRSSMFDWPPTGLEGAEGAYEKPRYEPPSQSYAMSDSYNSSGGGGPAQTVSYVTNETAYAPVPAAAPAASSYVERNQPQHAYPAYPPQNQNQHNQYQQQQQQQQQYPTYQENVTPPPDFNVAGAAGAASHGGVRDGSWVRVKVGFVRSLEDELAISPGQQLYLHQAYDDGWCLCEDSKQSRGVVPLSCIEPLNEGGNGNGLAPNSTGMSRSGSAGSNDGERLARRSSLYRGE